MKHVTEGSYGTVYYVSDMTKSKDFYQTVIGLSPRFESDEWTEFDLGDGTALCLHARKDGQKPIPGGTLIVNVKEIQSKVNELKKEGVEFFRDISEVHPGAYSADFIDPAGNLISFYENTNETNY